MSRTKSPADENAPAETTKVADNEKKIGLMFWLQKHPQKPTIKAMLVKKYKTVTKTEKEWNETLEALLAKKVVS